MVVFAVVWLPRGWCARQKVLAFHSCFHTRCGSTRRQLTGVVSIIKDVLTHGRVHDRMAAQRVGYVEWGVRDPLANSAGHCQPVCALIAAWQTPG